MRFHATISVVSHGHGPLLRRLLADIASLRLSFPVQVIVTLNLSSESLFETDFPSLALVVIRNQAPLGFGRNHNNAFKRCDGEWFFVLNPDLRISSDVFSAIVTWAESRKAVGLIAPAVLSPAGSLEDSVRANLTLPSLWARRRIKSAVELPTTLIDQSKGQPFKWFAGMFLCLRSRAFQQVAGFDERFHLYCEDYDLSARLYLDGHVLAYLPEVTVIHDARRDSHRSVRHLRWHLASLAKVWMSSAFWRVWQMERNK